MGLDVMIILKGILKRIKDTDWIHLVQNSD
jgi:hypothetical protein